MVLKGPKNVLRDLNGFSGTTRNREGHLKVLRGFLIGLWFSGTLRVLD